jgi:hypothetical protein
MLKQKLSTGGSSSGQSCTSNCSMWIRAALLRHVREDVPFQVVANVPGAEPGMNVQARLRIMGDIDFDLVNGRVVQQTAVIEAFLKVTRTVQLEVVVDVIFKDAPVPSPRTGLSSSRRGIPFSKLPSGKV